MTATTIATPTGKQVRTYYNSGTRASPVWVAIVGLSKEKFDYGEPTLFQTEDREMTRVIQQEGRTRPCKLTATYRRIAGAADTVWDFLMAHSIFSQTAAEFAVSNDAIANTGGIKYNRFFGKVSKLGEDRDVGKFVEQDIVIDEVEHYEGTPAALCPLMVDQTI